MWPELQPINYKVQIFSSRDNVFLTWNPEEGEQGRILKGLWENEESAATSVVLRLHVIM